MIIWNDGNRRFQTHTPIGLSLTLPCPLLQADMSSSRSVTKFEGQAFAEQHNMIFIETSALERVNVARAFQSILTGTFTEEDLFESIGRVRFADPFDRFPLDLYRHF